MVKFTVKASPAGQYYFPKEVRQELGEKLTLVCDTKAAVVFPEGTSIETVLESITIIAQDLSHRLQLQKKEDRG